MSAQTRSDATPPRPIRSVGIVARTHLHAAAEVLTDIARWLEARHVAAIFEHETATLAGLAGRDTRERDALPGAVELMLVLGGDGTLLGMADRIAQAGADIPILGVNFGSLGFLTEITLPELYPSLELALAGRADIDERRMLRSHTYRDRQRIADRIVLNDVVVTKGALSRLIELSISVGADFVTRIRGDGLIIASPTGSTAYNLSAGGPIVHPAVDALVLTPIAPHTLTNRPVVIPATPEVRVQPLIESDEEEEIHVAFDGHWGFRLHRGDTVTVEAAPKPMKLIRATTRSYFTVLREKLKWGEP